MTIGICKIEFYLPGLTSLKEKRSILKSMLKRLHNTFNVATAEIDYHDSWQSALIAVVTVSNSRAHTDQMLNNILSWIESHYPEAMIVKQDIELL